MSKKEHTHRARPAQQRTTSFTGAVKAPANERAHGNICVIDTCRCGAERKSNINGNAVERGVWS